jgi:hypothetical protein
LLLANFTGGYVYFFVRGMQIKRDMHELLKNLPDDELELIILTPEEFKTARVEYHEIKVDGKMYDIARIQTIDEALHVYCVHDEEEDNLLTFLNAVLNNIQNDRQSIPNAIVQFTGLQYLPVDEIVILISKATEITHRVLYTQAGYELLLPITTPPPKSLVFHHIGMS